MIKVYLAAPFFNPEQLAVVEAIENLAAKHEEVELYSPRKDGVLLGMSAEERREMGPKIFRTNCAKIDWADLMIAVIDNFDTGVVWEMGYGYALGIEIATFTNHDYGLNIMLKGCSKVHLKRVGAVEEFLSLVSCGWSLDAGVYSHLKNFEPATT